MNGQPIDKVQWIHFSQLTANDYNPNVVLNQELKLLELSILQHGWLHPIIINKDLTIIDGFHRYSITKQSEKIQKMTGGMIPAIVMDMTEPERMLFTIRINRAKGSHIAFKMADIVKKLINEYEYSPKEVSKQIGATKDEIDLLLQEDVLKKLDIQNHEYSKAWYPK